MLPGCTKVFAYLAGVLALLAMSTTVRADDVETREFSVNIDGKEAGTTRMTLIQKDDGVTYMSATVDVKFRHLAVLDYVIKIDAQEWWKDGQLIGLKTTGTDNGRKVEVTVALDNKQLRMRVNGKDSVVRPNVWTSSYWKLADARYHNKQVPILDSDSGKEFNCNLKYIGSEKIKVGVQLQECYHFQVSAAPGPVELWFDKYHRLVRQEFTESGHKAIVQLVNVKR